MKRPGSGAALLLAVACLGPCAAIAQALTLAPIFTDGAVLQRGRPVPVWGRGAPGSHVTVQMLTARATASVTAEGYWQVSLPALTPASSATLTVTSSSGDRVQRKNVAVGDVWLCAGQSNMEMTVRQAANADTEIAQSRDDDLRLFLVPRARTAQPAEGFAVPGQWGAAGPDTSGAFSAACFFMGQRLRAALQVPVGLVSAAWGGSVIQDWLSKPVLQRLGGFDETLAQLEQHDRDPQAADAAAQTQLEAWFSARAGSDALWRTATFAGRIENGTWEKWNIPALSKFDGLVRYRGRLKLTAAQARAGRRLNIGRVDDIDQTRVNDVVVGTTAGWDRVRSYALRPGLLKAGANIIDVLVADTGGDGGLWGVDQRGLQLDDGSFVPFEQIWELSPAAGAASADPPPLPPWAGNAGLATLHNGMIAPLRPYAVAGIAWYQGESNIHNPRHYAALLPALMADWRASFGHSTFLIVQIAAFGSPVSAPAPSQRAELRDVQRQVAAADAQARLVPTIDIGDPADIHPTRKKELGRRLALAALSAPTKRLEIVRQAASIHIRLPEAYRLLGGARAPVGFELCTAARQCRFVHAQLDAPDLISLSAEPSDRYVRYLWADTPLVSLFNDAAVPLPPFEVSIPEL